MNLAQGRLPNEVKQIGVTVSKNSGTFVAALGVTSTDPRWDQTYLTNYLETNVVNDLKRISGVSDVRVFGERKYAMRLWVDPKRLADNGLTAGDVVTALQAQNVQVAAGAIGAPPTNGHQPYEYSVLATGRLHEHDAVREHRAQDEPRRRLREGPRRRARRARRGELRRLAVVQRQRRRRPGHPAAAERQRAGGVAASARDDGPAAGEVSRRASATRSPSTPASSCASRSRKS